MSEKAQWQNRIVGYADVDPKTLAPNPQNYRRHPKRQGDAVTGSLNELGWIQDVLVNKTTGRMIDGHLRVELALQHGAQSVPVKYVELSEAEERLALATLDPLTYMAETDAAALGALLEGASTGDAALQEMIAKLAEDNGLFKPEPVQDVEPQIDRAEELRQKWGVSSGDLWALGEHRIICGDCTDAAVVARVMEGERADTMVSDPPYGIGYEYREHDDASNGDNLQLVQDAFANAPAARVWTCGLMNLARDLVWNPGAKVLAWHKGFAQAGNGLGGAGTWEPVLVVDVKNGTLPNDYLHFSTDREPGLRELHSCPKPAALFSHLIEHLAGHTVYEPFSGSGTTIIACENLGRKCRAVEISPGYVAVAIERWATATGRTPERIP